MNPKKVLVICHGFPPNPGVGGRRWAKIAKFMHLAGVDITVMHARADRKAYSPWIQDVQGIKNIDYPRRFPKVITGSVSGIYDRIAYRLWVVVLKCITKSNFYDRAVLLESLIKGLIIRITLRSGIKNLIVTGAPFSLLYYAALVKDKNPGLNFIADIRDSWLDINYFGFGIISEKRQKEEERRLRFVLQKADRVIVPNPILKKLYSDMGGGDKILFQPHGYDESLIDNTDHSRSNVNLVNFGSQYHGMDNTMELLSKALSSSGCILSFYTEDEKYRKVFSRENVLNQFVFFKNIVPEKEVFRILSESAAAVLFTTEANKDFIATKYIETAATRTPIIVVGVEGEASRFITENRLGVFTPENQIMEMIPKIREILNNLEYNKDFDVSEYSMKKQAEEIIQLMQ